MMTLPRRFFRLVLLLACLGLAPAGAATLTWNTPTAGGTWDLNTTSSWNNGSGAVKWTASGDTASVILNATGSSTISVDNSHGQVEAYGLTLGGTVGGTSQSLTLSAASGALELGAGGLTDALTSTTNKIVVSAPIALTASQTWATTVNSGNFTVTGAISSLSGTTDLTFDTRGAGTAAAIVLQGANTYSGTTTVRGGGTLTLDYNTGGSVSKIDAASALILAGGTLNLVQNTNSSTSYTQAVASTLVAAGANTVNRPNNATNITLQLGTITRNTGATLNVVVGNGTSTVQTDTHNDASGIIGGWATFGGTGWAMSASTGTDIGITQSTGTNRTSSSLWTSSPTSTENVNSTASESGIGSKTINNLRLGSASVALGFSSGATLTLNGGGLLAASTGQSVTGGNVTSGLVSGELFVHTPNAFTLGSAVIDNGATAVSLVKAGTNTLTLTAANTYTGTTYVNSGTLALGSGGSIANSGRVVVMAGATFDATTGGHTVGSGKILSGGGTVLGNVVVSSGGTIAPTVSYADASGATQLDTGILKLGGSLTLNDGSALDFNLGTNSDLLSLTGTAAYTLAGSASSGGIILTLADAGDAVVGNTYTLMQWNGNAILSSFDLSDFSVSGMTGTLALDTVNDRLTFTVATVPEPSALGFGLFGLLALALVVRRSGPGKAAA